jgi:hypothetical protein
VAPKNPKGVQFRVGEHFVTLSWRKVADADEYVVERSIGRQPSALTDTVVYRGDETTYTDRTVKKGVEYRYLIAAVDAAGNQSAGVVLTVTPRAVYLARPIDGDTIGRVPVDFRWAPVRNASYYNLQLYRETGRGAQAGAQATKATKVLSAWPQKAHFKLQRSWKYKGKRYKLAAGSYHWYVWPGFGPRAEASYGNLLGQSGFVVPKTKKKKP